jgi:DNA-binding LacI/PurR family transcriptional regulator
MAVTMVHVAKAAGVSVATVSRVVNRTGAVKEETRRRVEEAIQRLGYRPNLMARSLQMGLRDQVIGLVIPEIYNPVFPELAQAIEHEARRRGYQVMLCQTDGEWSVEMSYTQLLIDRKVTGIIYVAGAFSHRRGPRQGYQLAQAAGVPYVFVNARTDKPGTVTVIASDERQAGRLQAQYVVDRGHRRLGFLGGSADYYVTQDRLAGISEVVDAHAADHVTVIYKLGSFRPREARRYARELLTADVVPTAVMCASDLLALVIMREARTMGFRIPDDLSIIGFDGIQLGEYAWPPLTSVAQPLKEMGTLAVGSVLGETAPNTLSLSILDRGSVRSLP